MLQSERRLGVVIPQRVEAVEKISKGIEQAEASYEAADRTVAPQVRRRDTRNFKIVLSIVVGAVAALLGSFILATYLIVTFAN